MTRMLNELRMAFFMANDQLRHEGPTSVSREAELRTPSRVACSDLGLFCNSETNLIP